MDQGMTMTITIAAASARISRNLPEAETSLNSALLASTRLMESMLLAREAQGITAYAGQATIMRLAKTQRTLIETQNDMFRVHRELLDIGRNLGGDVIAMVPDEPGNCPDKALLDDIPLRGAA